jgi:hypothetical protein
LSTGQTVNSHPVGRATAYNPFLAETSLAFTVEWSAFFQARSQDAKVSAQLLRTVEAGLAQRNHELPTRGTNREAIDQKTCRYCQSNQSS